MARQHLPGAELRYTVPPVLVLVPALALEQALPAARGDPGVPARAVRGYGLRPHLRFGSGVAAAEFDERGAVWNLTLEDGSTLQATAVVCSVGQLGRPALPDIGGRESFAGPSWHSARWNDEVDLAGLGWP